MSSVLIFSLVLLIQQDSVLAFSSGSSSVPVWTHEMILDEGVEVKWVATDPYFLTMEMTAPTRGWVGVGFSPTGGMTGSDIAIGWVDSRGIPHLRLRACDGFVKDFHATHQGAPLQDIQQDYELIAAEERGRRTKVRFRRRWETCDEKNDMTIGNDTMRLIWAWHADDPELTSRIMFQWHGTKNRGVRSVYMRSPARPKHFPDDSRRPDQSIKLWDLKMSNVHVSSKANSYICRIVRFPHLNMKHHMIGFRPLITTGNEEYVHHMSLYHCQVPEHLGGTGAVFDKFFNREARECYSPNMPAEWSKHCFTFLFTWAVGSEGEMFPDHVGSPLGGSDASYFKLEIHYTNPLHRNHIVDSSGIRVFYTNLIREYDATTLFIGHRTTPFQMIPPRQSEFSSYGFCAAECTEKGFNPITGIRAISVMLHAHLTGRRVKLRHVRKGKELPPIAVDNHYDFNYQQFRILNSEVRILPGDELLVECEYNTSMRDQFVLGGPDAEQEMCEAVLFYYPKSDLTDCRSQPEFYSFFKALGIDNVTGDVLHKMRLPWTETPDEYDNVSLVPPDNSYQLMSGHYSSVDNPFDLVRITKPDRLRTMSVGDFTKQMNWDKATARRVERAWKNGRHYMFCAGPGQRKIFTRDRSTSYPRFREYRNDSRSDCRGGGGNRRRPQQIVTSHENLYHPEDSGSTKPTQVLTVVLVIATASLYL